MSETIITITNTGAGSYFGADKSPAIYQQKVAESGRYRSDVDKILRNMSSSIGKKLSLVDYNVDPKTGNLVARVAVPTEKLGMATETFMKASSDITNRTSFGGGKPLYLLQGTKYDSKSNTYDYSTLKTYDVQNMTFTQSFSGEKAKKSLIANIVKEGGTYTVSGSNVTASIPLYNKRLYDAPKLQEQLREGIVQSSIDLSSTYEAKKAAAESKKADAESKKSEDESRKAERRAEHDRKEKEKAKEKEAAEKESQHKAFRKAILAFFVTTIALVKKLISSLLNLAEERQKTSISAIQLGYTTSQLRDFNRTERILGLQTGAVESGTRSLYEKFGTELLLSQNADSLGKILLGVGYKESPNYRKLTDNILKMAKGKMTAADVFTDMMSMMMSNWIANGADPKVMQERINNLIGMGMGDAAGILTTYYRSYINASPEEQTKLASMNFLDWMYYKGVSVSDYGKAQQRGEEEVLKSRELVKAVFEGWESDVLATSISLFKQLNSVLEKILSYFNRQAEEDKIAQAVLEGGELLSEDAYESYRTFFSSAKEKDIGIKLLTDTTAKEAYMRFLLETGKFKEGEAAGALAYMQEMMLANTGRGVSGKDILETFLSIPEEERANFLSLADKAMFDPEVEKQIKDSYLYRTSKDIDVTKDVGESKRDFRQRKAREKVRYRIAQALWLASKIETWGWLESLTPSKNNEYINLMHSLISGEYEPNVPDTPDTPELQLSEPMSFNLPSTSGTYNLPTGTEVNHVLTIRVQDRNGITDIGNIPLDVLKSEIRSTLNFENGTNGLVYTQMTGDNYNG